MADPSFSQVSTAIPAAESYSQLANPVFEAELALRTADKEAAFFLPHLRPGMRLLDLGSGPGSITLGLAEKVVAWRSGWRRPSAIASRTGAGIECCAWGDERPLRGRRCLSVALSRWLLRRRLCPCGADASPRARPSAGRDAPRAPPRRLCRCPRHGLGRTYSHSYDACCSSSGTRSWYGSASATEVIPS